MSAVFSSYGKPGLYHDLAVFFYYTDALNTKDYSAKLDEKQKD